MLEMLLVTLFLSLLSTIYGEKLSYLPSRDTYPHVVAHRGASGYVPEHSLQAYQLAIDLKADYIEPDLCLTKDGVFVAMHDVLLDDTTNVASFPEYSNRYTTKDVEGINTTGYFVSDFTLSEIQTLRLKQRLSATRTQLYDGLFTIPTFDDIMSLAQSTYQKTGRMIGIYPELKKPSYHHSLGFEMEDMFLTSLNQGGYQTIGNDVPNNLKQVVPVLVQCFDPRSLIYLRSKSNLPLLQLLDKTNQTFWEKATLTEIATFANALGPEKSYFENAEYSVALQTVNLIHEVGLFFHPWTLRADYDIGSKFNGDFTKQEMYFYCCLGADGMFTEFPDQTRETINLMHNYTLSNAAGATQSKCSINCESP